MNVDETKRKFLKSVSNCEVVLQGSSTELSLELTTNCQLRCLSCPRTNGKGRFSVGNLDYSVYQKIAKDSFAYLDYLNLTGGLGEPLLHPQIKLFLELARDLNPRMIISIASNLCIADACRIIGEIISYLSFIQVSIDGIQELFDEIAGITGAFLSFDKNAKELISISKSVKTDIRFNCVVSETNLPTLNEIVSYISSIGGNNLYLNTLNLVASPQSIDLYSLYFDEYYEIVDKVIAHGAKVGVTIDFFDMRKNKGFCNCPYVWNNFYINHSGDLLLCCAQPFPDTFNAGNLMDFSLMELVNSSKMKKLRQFSIENISPQMCKKCHMQFTEEL